MSSLIEMGQRAKDAAVVLATLSTPAKNKALLASADALLAAKAEILAKNKADVDAAVEAGIKGAFIDRLMLTEARLADMAEGLRQVAKLDDPVGEVLSMKTLDNGLVIGQKRVPMGVIGIIFEARPNVAADAFGLCLKAGSAVILRGGSEAGFAAMFVANAMKRREGAPCAGDILLLQPSAAQFHLGIWSGESLIHADGVLRRVVETPGALAWPLASAWYF